MRGDGRAGDEAGDEAGDRSSIKGEREGHRRLTNKRGNGEWGMVSAMHDD